MNPEVWIAQFLPRFEDWNRTHDQTHIHHTLIIGVMGLWTALWWRLGVAGEWSSQGIATGLLAGLVAYSYRELSWRIRELYTRGEAYDRWRRGFDLELRSAVPLNVWDGFMDVLVPAWVWGAWSLDQFGYHTASVIWLIVSTALVFFGYAFWRPKGVWRL